MQEGSDTSIETTSKLLPLVYLYLTVLSLVGNQGYYSSFNIDITHYMGLQELATSPFHDWVGLFRALLVVMGFGFLVSTFFSLIEIMLFLLKKNLLEQKWQQIKYLLLNSFNRNRITILMVSAFVVTSINLINGLDILNGLNSKQYIFLIIAVSLIAFLLNYLLPKKVRSYKKITLFFFPYILLNTYYFLKHDDAEAIISGERTSTKVDLTINKTISFSNLSLIGESTSHIFIYEAGDSSTLAFRKGDITKIRYSKKP